MKRKPFSHWPWYVTGPALALILIVFWMLDASFLSSSKSPVSVLLENPLLTFGLVIFGSFISAYLSGDMDVRAPLTGEPFGYAIGGGILMGLGAVLAAMSVHSVAIFNLAGIFHLTAFMTVQGLVYVLFMIAGGFAGSRIFLKMLERTTTSNGMAVPVEMRSGGWRKMIFVWSLAIFGVFLAAVAFFSVLPAQEKLKFIAANGLLLVFGAVAERGTVCMSSMLKEWFIARTAYVWRSILFTVMCLALFYHLSLKAGWCVRFTPPEFVPQVGLLALGSFCMGAGFIFADGCFIGSLWKIGQGNLVNVAGFLGMLVGTGIGRAVLATGQEAGTGSLPNDLELLLPRAAFVSLLWVAGLWLLVVNRPRKMW